MSEYITIVIILCSSFIKFKLSKVGFVICRDRFNRFIFGIKDIDQLINDFAKLDWELISIKNVKTLPDYNYFKREYKIFKTYSIFYLFFKREFIQGKRLIPDIGSDYQETRSEEVKDVPPEG